MKVFFRPAFLLRVRSGFSTWAIVTIILLVNSTCQRRTDMTLVEITCNECAGKTVELGSFDLLKPENYVVAKEKFNNRGQAVLTFNIPNDIFLRLEVDSADSCPIYVFAGEKTIISYINNTPVFEGKHRRFHQYYLGFREIENNLVTVADPLRLGLDASSKALKEAFLKTAKSQVQVFENRIQDDNQITDTHKKVLQFHIQSFNMWLADSFHEPESDEIYENWQKNGNKNNGYAPDFFKKLPISADGVKKKFPFYVDLINSELLHHLWKPIEFHLDETEVDYDDGTIGLMGAQVIASTGFPEPLYELLLAKNLHFCLQKSVLTESVSKLYDQFLQRFPHSAFIPELKKQYGESKALSTGEPAMNIIAYKENGEQLHLSDLKGKVVYIDFWATWCGPCIAEFPHSRKLIKQFSEDKDVVFLFVSLDRDVEKWKSFLAKEEKLDGLHTISGEKSDTTANVYRVTAIPHYILIDHLGNIESANAPRPSQKETAGLIKEMLAAAKVR